MAYSRMTYNVRVKRFWKTQYISGIFIPLIIFVKAYSSMHSSLSYPIAVDLIFLVYPLVYTYAFVLIVLD
jgi:hypothetical protein